MTRPPPSISAVAGPSGGDLPAVLAAREVERRGLRGDVRAGYVRAAHGVHVAAGAELTDPDLRIAVAMAGAPASVTLGGWGAARLHEKLAVARLRDRGGVRRFAGHDGPPSLVFDGTGSRPDDFRPLLLLAPPEVRLARREGQRLLRSRVSPDERTTLDGFCATTAVRTAFDLARTSRPEDAVVGLDRLRALGLVRADDLRELVRERSRWKGAAAAARALALSADGVESPQETRMRLAWLEAGLPAPLCNPEVLDAEGRFVARVDVLDPSSGLAAEYDGAVHSAADRRSADADRQERLRAIGIEVLRATSVDLATPGARARWQRRARVERARAASRRTSASWRLAP